MRKVQLADFYASAQKETGLILDNDNLTIGLESDNQLKAVLLSAKRHGELISAQAGLDAITSRIVSGNATTRPQSAESDKFMAEVIDLVSRQEYVSTTFIQIMFNAGHLKARRILERLEALGIIQKQAKRAKWKVRYRNRQ